MQKPSRFLKLKDNHPTMQKLQKLMALADELQISISFSEHGPATIHDKERDANLPPLIMEDLENSSYPMEYFPPSLEFKVIYENPEFLAFQQKEEEERRLAADKKAAEAQEKERLRKEKLKAEAAEKHKHRRQKRIKLLEKRIVTDIDQLAKLKVQTND